MIYLSFKKVPKVANRGGISKTGDFWKDNMFYTKGSSQPVNFKSCDPNGACSDSIQLKKFGRGFCGFTGKMGDPAIDYKQSEYEDSMKRNSDVKLQKAVNIVSQQQQQRDPDFYQNVIKDVPAEEFTNSKQSMIQLAKNVQDQQVIANQIKQDVKQVNPNAIMQSTQNLNNEMKMIQKELMQKDPGLGVQLSLMTPQLLGYETDAIRAVRDAMIEEEQLKEDITNQQLETNGGV